MCRPAQFLKLISVHERAAEGQQKQTTFLRFSLVLMLF